MTVYLEAMSVANIQAAFLLLGNKVQKEIEQEDEEEEGEEDEGEGKEKGEGGDGGDERWNYCQSNNFKVGEIQQKSIE